MAQLKARGGRLTDVLETGEGEGEGRHERSAARWGEYVAEWANVHASLARATGKQPKNLVSERARASAGAAPCVRGPLELELTLQE